MRSSHPRSLIDHPSNGSKSQKNYQFRSLFLFFLMLQWHRPHTGPHITPLPRRLLQEAPTATEPGFPPCALFSSAKEPRDTPRAPPLHLIHRRSPESHRHIGLTPPVLQVLPPLPSITGAAPTAGMPQPRPPLPSSPSATISDEPPPPPPCHTGSPSLLLAPAAAPAIPRSPMRRSHPRRPATLSTVTAPRVLAGMGHAG
jgi:WAS/WASL-interacting protein